MQMQVPDLVDWADLLNVRTETLTVLLSNINYLAIKLLDEIELLKFKK